MTMDHEELELETRAGGDGCPGRVGHGAEEECGHTNSCGWTARPAGGRAGGQGQRTPHDNDIVIPSLNILFIRVVALARRGTRCVSAGWCRDARGCPRSPAVR